MEEVVILHVFDVLVFTLFLRLESLEHEPSQLTYLFVEIVRRYHIHDQPDLLLHIFRHGQLILHF